MKKLLCTALIITGLALSVSTNSVLAGTKTQLIPGLTQEKGWSGSVGLSIGGVSGVGQLNAYDSEKRIDSLNEKAARYNYDYILPVFQVYYTFQNNITIGTGGDLLDGGGIDISYTLADQTLLKVSLPLFLGTINEIWQDPYLTGKARQTTEAELESAIGFSIENIGGSFASIRYAYQNLSIKNDHAGESRFDSTSDEIKRLRRATESHRFSADLPPLRLATRLYLIGGMSYTRTDAKGDANSFTAYSIDLTLAYEMGNFEFFGHFSGGKASYREVNPIFDIKRRGDLSTIAAGVTYWNPFNWKNSSVDLTIVSEEDNSNINFYDIRDELLTAGLNYHF